MDSAEYAGSVDRVTRRGRRVLADLRAARQRALDKVWQDLAPRDLERFARFAGRLADRLEAYTEAAEFGL